MRQLVRRGMAASLPRRCFMTTGPHSCGAVALTFDDGPDPDHTPDALDRLRDLGVHATFFVIGRKAAAHPALIDRMGREGHAIGHHSWEHAPPQDTSALRLLHEARRTADLLARILGQRPFLYRPPHGKLTPAKLVGLWALRQTVVLWNRDPKDFAAGSPDSLRQWFEGTALAAGDIVLLHDVHRNAVAAIDAAVGRARALGLGFTTPGEWRRA